MAVCDSQAETQLPSDDELRIELPRIKDFAGVTPPAAAAIFSASAAAGAPPLHPFMGGIRKEKETPLTPPPTPTRNKLDTSPVKELSMPRIFTCISCEKEWPTTQGKFVSEENGVWCCYRCKRAADIMEGGGGGQKEEEDDGELPRSRTVLRFTEPSAAAPAAAGGGGGGATTTSSARRVTLKTPSQEWIDEGEKLTKELKADAELSQAPPSIPSSSEHRERLKKLADKNKKRSASALAVASALLESEEEDDGEPRKKLECVNKAIPFMPATLRLDELNRVKHKPWLDRIPPCVGCVERRVPQPRTAVCLASCGHFISCVDCMVTGDALLEGSKCPIRDCYAEVSFVTIARNATN